MPITFTSSVQELTYRKVADYLSDSELFQESAKPDDDQPRFHLSYGSALVDVDVLPWEFHPWDSRDLAIVQACSCVTIGSRINSRLLRFLLMENSRMRFGAFHLDEHDRVLFSESVLGGESLDLMELQTCILAVVTIADSYDDIIRQKFGGQRTAALE
jgi:hypothetical protein